MGCHLQTRSTKQLYMYYCCAGLFGTTGACLFAYLLYDPRWPTLPTSNQDATVTVVTGMPRSTFPASKVWRFADCVVAEGYKHLGCEKTFVKNAVNYQPQLVELLLLRLVVVSHQLFAVFLLEPRWCRSSSINNMNAIISQTLSYNVLCVYLICTCVYLLFWILMNINDILIYYIYIVHTCIYIIFVDLNDSPFESFQ